MPLAKIPLLIIFIYENLLNPVCRTRAFNNLSMILLFIPTNSNGIILKVELKKKPQI